MAFSNRIEVAIYNPIEVLNGGHMRFAYK